MSLPTKFCWTKFGTEAGESIGSILVRKERERTLNGGIFLWGIGNGLGPSIVDLLEASAHPELIFSPIKSKPRAVDEKPSGLLLWTSGLTVDGRRVALPKHSFVTSRSHGTAKPRAHFALVCKSSLPLSLDPTGVEFNVGQVTNLRSGKPVGSSQVTSVVGYSSNQVVNQGKSYQVAMRATLAAPYYVRLIDPIPVPSSVQEVVTSGIASLDEVAAMLADVRDHSRSRTGLSDSLPLFSWQAASLA